LKSIGLKRRASTLNLLRNIWLPLSVLGAILLALYLFTNMPKRPFGNILLAIGLVVLTLLLIEWQIIQKSFYKKTYYACPDCGMSILVKYKWQCEQCYQFQTEDRFIHEVCDVCGIGYLEKFTCPFSPCEKEFNL